MERIRLNYETLDATWEECSEIATQSEVKARINGVSAKMKDFNFFFGLMLAERILKHADNLSKTIQATTMSAVEAHHISQLSVSVLEKMRTDESFDQFWALVCSSQQSLDINDPVLPRARKRPRRYDEGIAEPYIPSDVKQHYRQIYYQSLDQAIMAILRINFIKVTTRHMPDWSNFFY